MTAHVGNRHKEVLRLTAEDADLILAIRLLMARAANKDSLGWWDDESLTTQGSFLLERLFPVAPSLAGRSLALQAAYVRHQAACAFQGAVHLYHLDPDRRDALALQKASRLSIATPGEPITSLARLEQHLLMLTGGRASYRVVRKVGDSLHIEIPPAPTSVSPWRHRAQTLAWAYLEGAPGVPLFPFSLEQ